jgi:hypothetical protein
MNTNYRIKTIAIPEYNEANEPTGAFINLEVISIEKLKAVVQTQEGGTMTTEGLYIVCFEKEIGKPQRLHVVSTESNGEIIITKIEKHYDKINEFGRSDRTHRRKNGTGRFNNNSDNSNIEKQIP